MCVSPTRQLNHLVIHSTSLSGQPGIHRKHRLQSLFTAGERNKTVVYITGNARPNLPSAVSVLCIPVAASLQGQTPAQEQVTQVGQNGRQVGQNGRLLTAESAASKIPRRYLLASLVHIGRCCGQRR